MCQVVLKAPPRDVMGEVLLLLILCVRTEVHEIKEIAKVSRFMVPFTPLFCLPRQCMKSFCQEGAEGPWGKFHILLPPACISLDNWIIPRLSGFEPGGRGFWMQREWSRVGLTEGRGAQ